MTRTQVPIRLGKGGVGIHTHLEKLMKELKPNNVILQGGLVKAQTSADMTVKYPDLIVAISGTVIEVPTANTAALTAASASKKKMAILEVGTNGVVDITYGAEVDSASTPVAPATSAGHAKICEIGPIAANTTTIVIGLINNTARDMIC